MIKFRCECGQKIGVPDDAVGKRCKCPKCEKISRVPTPKEDVPPETPLFELEELQESYEPPPQVVHSYHPQSHKKESADLVRERNTVIVLVLGLLGIISVIGLTVHKIARENEGAGKQAKRTVGVRAEKNAEARSKKRKIELAKKEREAAAKRKAEAAAIAKKRVEESNKPKVVNNEVHSMMNNYMRDFIDLLLEIYKNGRIKENFESLVIKFERMKNHKERHYNSDKTLTDIINSGNLAIRYYRFALLNHKMIDTMQVGFTWSTERADKELKEYKDNKWEAGRETRTCIRLYNTLIK